MTAPTTRYLSLVFAGVLLALVARGVAHYIDRLAIPVEVREVKGQIARVDLEKRQVVFVGEGSARLPWGRDLTLPLSQELERKPLKLHLETGPDGGTVIRRAVLLPSLTAATKKGKSNV